MKKYFINNYKLTLFYKKKISEAIFSSDQLCREDFLIYLHISVQKTN